MMIIKLRRYHNLCINFTPAVVIVIIELSQPMPQYPTESLACPANVCCRKHITGTHVHTTILHRLHSVFVITMTSTYCGS